MLRIKDIYKNEKARTIELLLNDLSRSNQQLKEESYMKIDNLEKIIICNYNNYVYVRRYTY